MTKKSDRRIKRWMTALFQGRFSGLMEKTWNSNSLESQKIKSFRNHGQNCSRTLR